MSHVDHRLSGVRHLINGLIVGDDDITVCQVFETHFKAGMRSGWTCSKMFSSSSTVPRTFAPAEMSGSASMLMVSDRELVSVVEVK